MAGSVNKVILIGNLGADPEIRRTQDGRPVANLRLATSESWKDKTTGERKEKTEWHRVVIFNENLCRIAEQYLKKGSKVFIEGALQTRKWQDQSGQDRYSTEVVLQGFRGELTLLDRAGGSGAGAGGGGGDFGADDTRRFRLARAVAQGCGCGRRRCRRTRRWLARRHGRRDSVLSRHCEEPTGPARSGRPDDRLRDEAIQLRGAALDCFAALAMTKRCRIIP